ncbi:MAG TPA: aspartate ammonia-lyase [Candidatus Acidoferrales bacterium]|nr:aspartate ammonia-lyase [Candidatus Acidoferrales bacterium]
MNNAIRIEEDFLGDRPVPAGVLHGIHTVRALENFPIARRPVHAELARAYGTVKQACARTNRALGAWASDPAKGEAIELACAELSEGRLVDQIVVDALQGGAGTSTNLNVNEVLANRALEILGLPPGSYDRVSPLDDLNLHQSTNDTYPTALKLAAIRLLRALEKTVVALQESFQGAEKKFAHIVKIGRTQMQDAVLTTLGREFSAYAEAVNRDRWRIYKCEERLRVVNLGGTAIGTGIAAPRQFIFQAVETLRELSGIGFARAENLVDATQNADVFVEVSGILKAHAVSLLKICTDLRLLASGPEAGFGEIHLPARQAGSSIMPGKVNPVIPEAASQAAMLVMGHDVTIGQACAAGSLELNSFLPLVANCLLESLDLLASADDVLRRHCVEGIEADEARCRDYVENSTATATALVSLIGYECAAEAARLAKENHATIRETVMAQGWLTGGEFDVLISPENVCRLGTRGQLSANLDKTERERTL